MARGNRDAYAALYARYSPLLLGLLIRILRSRAEAEDVLHEVFLHVWRRADEFDAERGRASVWLTMLARSRALDRLDALGSRDRLVGTAPEMERPDERDPAEEASTAEERRLLCRALASIPATQRDVILLAYFEGLSQSEIATRLDRPLGTVKSSARLGLTKLRELLRARFGSLSSTGR